MIATCNSLLDLSFIGHIAPDAEGSGAFARKFTRTAFDSLFINVSEQNGSSSFSEGFRGGKADPRSSARHKCHLAFEIISHVGLLLF
jgi:hypothetical protein